MPFLAVDLDAMEKIPDVADALGTAPGTICWGLMRMWRHAWRESTEKVTIHQLSGFFPALDVHRVATTLSAFGFLKNEQAGVWEVRGASRYLRVQEARSKGGKAARGNLRQYRDDTGSNTDLFPATPPAGAGSHPELPSGSPPGLTANSEQRSTSSEQRNDIPPGGGSMGGALNLPGLIPADPPPKPAKENRIHRLKLRLVATYEGVRRQKYGFDGAKDANAVKRLASMALDDDEIDRRWRNALSDKFGAHGLAAFAASVNKWGGATVRAIDVRRGTVPAESQVHEGKGGELAKGEF